MYTMTIENNGVVTGLSDDSWFDWCPPVVRVG